MSQLDTNAKALATEFAQNRHRGSKSFRYDITGTQESVVIVVSRVSKIKKDRVTEGMEKISKSIQDSTVSFLPAGRCACCGR